MLPMPTSLMAGFSQTLRHTAKASSPPMLPNTILNGSQFAMAQPGFEPTTLWFDIWSGFELYFWPYKSIHPQTDRTNPLQLSIRSARTLRLSVRAHTSLNSLSHPQISVSHWHEITAPAKVASCIFYLFQRSFLDCCFKECCFSSKDISHSSTLSHPFSSGSFLFI